MKVTGCLTVCLFVDMKEDCDGDTLLITARPQGPVCHTGSDTCFGRIADDNGDFLYKLQTIIAQRAEQAPEESYTARLLDSGMNKIAQKVGKINIFGGTFFISFIPTFEHFILASFLKLNKNLLKHLSRPLIRGVKITKI